MQKITIKELVTFRRKSSDRTKKNYAYKLKYRKEKVKTETKNEGGGDYWITSTSCIYNVFKNDKKEYYDSKIEELQTKYEKTDDIRIKSMYERNINILNSFKDFDFDELRPTEITKIEKVHTDSKIITKNAIPLYVNPSMLFCHERNGKKEIGALWLVPQLEGFKKSELGMFCEILYQFLSNNYSANYQISDDFCIVIDTFNTQTVTYSELLNGKIPFLIDETINQIKNA